MSLCGKELDSFPSLNSRKYLDIYIDQDDIFSARESAWLYLIRPYKLYTYIGSFKGRYNCVTYACLKLINEFSLDI